MNVPARVEGPPGSLELARQVLSRWGDLKEADRGRLLLQVAARAGVDVATLAGLGAVGLAATVAGGMAVEYLALPWIQALLNSVENEAALVAGLVGIFSLGAVPAGLGSFRVLRGLVQRSRAYNAAWRQRTREQLVTTVEGRQAEARARALGGASSTAAVGVALRDVEK